MNLIQAGTRRFYVYETSTILSKTASLDFVQQNMNSAVSGDHCQAGTEKIVYHVSGTKLSAAEIPSRTGIFTSRIAKSGLCSWANSIASAPSAAWATTSYPASPNISTRSIRISASSSATRILIRDGVALLVEFMCLESDSNRHYAVFETALSTVGVPRPSTVNLNGKQELRHPLHHPRGERASHWLSPEFLEVSRRL